jgi:hypothetical protein
VAVRVAVDPEHIVVPGAVGAAGIGLTVIENDTGTPVQPFKTGVMVIVAVIAAPLVLVAANEGMSPLPAAASPIAVFEFVQEKEAPDGLLVRLIDGTVDPWQKVAFAGVSATGIGLTVTTAALDATEPQELVTIKV